MEKLPLQRQSPSNDINVFRKSHRQQHFRSEDSTVSDLDPLLQAFVVRKDFHRRLSVRVVGGLEAKFFHTQLLEELADHPEQITKG